MRALTKKLKTLRLGDIAIRRNPMFYARACRELRALEGADVAARREWTRAKLAEALANASRSGYGRRIGATSELGSWPLLDKTSVVRDPDAYVCGARLVAVKASTGGTSGAPLPLVRTWPSVVFEQACIDSMIARLEVAAPRARIAVLRGDDVKDPSDWRPPYWKLAAGGRRLVMSSSHLNALTVGHYADALEAFAPDLLWAHPSSVESLCVHLSRAGRKLTIPGVLTASEVLRPEVWRFVARTLYCRLLDYYGQAEQVAFAYAQTPAEYRFLPGYAHVELLPVGEDDGQTLCEIVGTSLRNRAMPLVRYRTGDLLRVPSVWGTAELEEVALGLRTFAGILGRDTDILISPEGVRLTAISHFQRDVANLVRIQVIQETVRDVSILVLATCHFSPADEAQLRANVAKKLPASMRLSIERVETLERTKQGKAPFVIHRPAVKELLRATAAWASAG